MWNLWEEIKSPAIESKPLVSYIRDNKGNKKGMIVAAKYNGEICLGWSLCNDLDTFDKYDGYMIAEGRLLSNDRMSEKYIVEDNIYFNLLLDVFEDYDNDEDILDVLPEPPMFHFFDMIPITVQNEIPNIMGRATRYFKDEKFSDVFKYFTVVDKYKILSGYVDSMILW